MTPDGHKVYVSSDGASMVGVIDTITDHVVSSVDVGLNSHGLAISPDGRKLIVMPFGANQALVIRLQYRPYEVWLDKVGAEIDGQFVGGKGMFGAASARATVAKDGGGVIHGAHSHWHKHCCDQWRHEQLLHSDRALSLFVGLPSVAASAR